MNGRFTRLGVVVLAAMLPLVASAAAAPRAQEDVLHGAYVISEVSGQAICTEATAEEARLLNRRPSVPMHVFGERTGKLRSDHEGETHLNIILRGTEQLEANAEAKAAFEKAAAIWEGLIANPITIYVDVDYGAKRFGQDWPSSSVIASAGTPSYLYSDGDFAEFRSMFIARADNAHELAVYNSFPLTEFVTDVGNVSAFGGGANILRLFGFEQFPAIADPADNASSIGFNSAFSYDFDPSDGITPGKKDFVGVVVHEIGHMLGFSSRVGATETNPSAKDAPSIFDFFRFRPGVNLSTFASASRILKTGGDQVYFGGNLEHGLSTGNPRGENGDGQQASHWKDDSQSSIYVGVMDPTIPSSRRVELTRYDLEAFGMMGYNIVRTGCSELEPNDRTSEASDAEFATPCTGATGLTEGPVVTVKNSAGASVWVQDFFKVTLPDSAKLNVALSFTNAAANLDLYLMRADNSILAESIGTSTNEVLESGTLDAGTYYIGISSTTGTSTYSIQVTPIGLKPPAPNAPTSLIATPASSATIRLTWLDNALNETDFRIERKSGDTFVTVDTVPANTVSYIVTGLSADSPYTFRVLARNEGGESAYTAEASAKTLVAPGACVSSDTTVCLANDRFRVTVDYLNQFANPPQPGKLRTAKLLPGAQNPDTATFGFGSAQNIEVVVRIQDTRPFGLNRFDVYYGGMTDVEYTVTVQDMQTGATRLYRNLPGMVGGGVDRTSFPTDGTLTPMYQLVQGTSATRQPIVAPNVAPSTCSANANTTCLVDGRFAVKIDFLNQFANPPAPGSLLGAKLLPGSQNPDTAIYGFGSPQAIEAVVRIQDARPFGLNRFDIYYGGMTDVEYTVTVTDTVTGTVRKYNNPPGSVGGGVDRTSFDLGHSH
jgi:Fibronectin type III domain/Bacterial pre-peptidase C-terminal domain